MTEDPQVNALPPGVTLFTPDEAGSILKVTGEQVRNLIRRGQLSAVNVGSGTKRPLYRIPRQALEDFLNRRWQPGPAIKPRRPAKKLPPVPDFFPGLR